MIENLETAAEDVTREAALARREIREGRFQRSMAIIAAFSAIVSGYEAFAQHQRGAFSNWLMWTPVWLTGPMVAAALAALASEPLARTLLPAMSLVMLADGIVGFVLHIRGILRLAGGLKVGQYNVVMGPPVFAPLLLCTVGVTGLMAAFLRREVASLPRRHTMPNIVPWAGIALRQGRSRRAAFAAAVSHGRFQQAVAATAAFLGILAGGEAYFEHLRGSFNQRWMWTPIWTSFPMVGAAVGAIRSPKVARSLLPLVSVVTFVDGLLGFFLHLRGISRMPGGFSNLRFNLTIGPPLFAPLLFTSVGLMGLVASLLRRR